MGLFDKIFGKQLLKVIEWTDDSSDILVYKYPMDSRYAIMKGSQLVVRPSQRAVFVNEGKIADIFEEGRYVLDTSNLPILTALCNWKYAFENPFQGFLTADCRQLITRTSGSRSDEVWKHGKRDRIRRTYRQTTRRKTRQKSNASELKSANPSTIR